MANWKLRIDGVGPVLRSFPEEEPRIPVIAKQVTTRVREGLRQQPRYGVILQPAMEMVERILADLEAVAELGEDPFNIVLARLYDWADAERVWIEPLG